MKNKLFTSDCSDILTKDSRVILDTNVFIGASKNDNLLDWLHDLAYDKGVLFYLVDVVAFEFTRGCKKIEDMTTKRALMSAICDKYIPNSSGFVDSNFSFVMSKLTAGVKTQFTDFILASLLFDKSMKENGKWYIISGDIKAFSLHIFNIEGVVNFGIESKMSSLYIISVNAKMLAKEMELVAK